MIKNFTQFKKLLIAASLSLLGIHYSSGAVIYHDETPDVTQTLTADGYQQFEVDMDGDLTIDFVLSVFKGDTLGGNGSAVGVTPSGSNATAEAASAPVSTVTAYDAGSNINSGLTWQTNVSLLRFDGTIVIPASYGNFTGSTDKYMGVRFTIGANTHYGWIRVAVSSTGDSYTVKDWAYEDTQDTDIDAGEMPVASVANQLASQTTVKNQNNIIELTFAENLSGRIQVINMAGSVVALEKFDGKSCKVNLQGRTSGIYNLVFETTSGEFAKKIYID